MPDLDYAVRMTNLSNPLREPVLRAAIQALGLPPGSCGLDAGCGIGIRDPVPPRGSGMLVGGIVMWGGASTSVARTDPGVPESLVSLPRCPEEKDLSPSDNTSSVTVYSSSIIHHRNCSPCHRHKSLLKTACLPVTSRTPSPLVKTPSPRPTFLQYKFLC